MIEPDCKNKFTIPMNKNKNNMMWDSHYFFDSDLHYIS